MKKHTCIKPICSNTYEDNDPDAYYCPSCQEHNKVVAKQIDSKMVGKVSKKPFSALQEYNNSTNKVGGFMITKL